MKILSRLKIFYLKHRNKYWTERRFNHEVDGWIVSGQPDLYNDGVIEDYKVTSYWVFLNGVKPEWERQLNVYAWGTRKDGYDVTGLKIHAILRDWQQGKIYESGYPSIPFVTYDVPLWTFEEQEAYVRERVRIHKEPAGQCTSEERWARADTWAVKKLGRKSAIRVFDSQSEAMTYFNKTFRVPSEMNNHYIKKRPGKNARCEGYCQVSEFCPYYKKETVDEIEPGI